MFLTQCPYCETIFQTDTSLLSAHGGKVVCGECRNVFNAFAHPYQFHVKHVPEMGSDSKPEAEISGVTEVSVDTPIKVPVSVDSASTQHPVRMAAENTASETTKPLFDVPDLDVLLSESVTLTALTEPTHIVATADTQPSSTEGLSAIIPSDSEEELLDTPIVIEPPTLTADVLRADTDIPVPFAATEKISTDSASAFQHSHHPFDTVPGVPEDLATTSPVVTTSIDTAETVKPISDERHDQSDDIEDILSLLRRREPSIKPKENPTSVDTTISLSAVSDEQEPTVPFLPLQGDSVSQALHLNVQNPDEIQINSSLPTGKSRKYVFLCGFLVVLLLVQVVFFFGDMLFGGSLF